MRCVPTAQEIADFAVACASQAVAQLVDFIGDEPLAPQERQPEIILMNASNRIREEDYSSGRHWLLDAAGCLVISALATVGPPPAQD
jgi:hypothetical protein